MNLHLGQAIPKHRGRAERGYPGPLYDPRRPSILSTSRADGGDRLRCRCRRAPADLAVADANTGVSVLLGNGDGTFGVPFAEPSQYAAGSYPHFVAVGDFNGDGFPDLAVADVGSNSVAILINDGM